jgi:gluconolactonase
MALRLINATAAMHELVDPGADLRKVAEGFVFTEGPVWNAEGQFLLFSDIQNDTRWRWSEADGARVVARPNYIGNGMIYAANGDLVVCEHVTSSVVRIRPNGDRSIVAFHYGGTYLNSPNDVVERSDGSIYFSDPNYGRWDHPVGIARKFELGFQGVFRVPPGGGEAELVVAEDEFEQPNGLCFSPDESVLYINDLQDVKAFDVAPDGSLSDARDFCDGMGSDEIPGNGNPDGMKIDELGNLWCTARNGVWVLSPSGELLGIIETPEVTANLAWGGDDWRSLFLCTSTSLHVLKTKVRPTPLPYHEPRLRED